MGKKSNVGAGHGARRFPNRTVVDFQNPFDRLPPIDLFTRLRITAPSCNPFSHTVIQDIHQEGRFAGTGNTGNTNQGPQRNPDVLAR